jgi:hypothetical protein
MCFRNLCPLLFVCLPLVSLLPGFKSALWLPLIVIIISCFSLDLLIKLMGKDLLIRANSDYKSISKSLANKYLVLFAVFFTFGLFVFLFRIQFQNTSLIELFGAIISWGTLSGFVLLIYGHALIHKDNPYLRLMTCFNRLGKKQSASMIG